ncbi:E3 ubiquitin-protein ligase Rnf220-like [Ascaphus truei]|uniref:E3 ubiquitin-protein ligase Rnf220-like n=1 Tax=Ascaphus truei TaxID=8439 RepID=UPI003F59B0D5
MDNSPGLINPLTSPALLVMTTSSDGPRGGGTQQPPHYTVPMSMDKPPQISYLSPGYPILYPPQERLNPNCPPQLLSLPPQYGHPRLERGGVGVLGYGALHPFSAFQGVERFQPGFLNPNKRLKVEPDPPQIRYLHLEAGLEAPRGQAGAGIHPTSHRSPPKTRAISSKRDKKSVVSLSLLCPLCHKYLQREELSKHLRQEMDLLTHLSESESDATLEPSIPQSPVEGAESRSESPVVTSEDGQKLDRQQIFLQVKWNREERLGARVGRCKRVRGNMGEIVGPQSLRSTPLDAEVSQEGRWGEEEAPSPAKPLSEPKPLSLPLLTDLRLSPGSSSHSHSEESDSDEGPAVIAPKCLSPGSSIADPAVPAVSVPQRNLETLRGKIQQLTERLRHTHTCHICLDSYSVPVTSIQCWHIHCEGCWLRALGTKKLCPQCNTITSPCDLRRVYL